MYVFMPLIEPLVGYDLAQAEGPAGPRRTSALGWAILWAWLPMCAAVVISFGLAVGTLFTLGFVPVAYSVFDGREDKKTAASAG